MTQSAVQRVLGCIAFFLRNSTKCFVQPGSCPSSPPVFIFFWTNPLLSSQFSSSSWVWVIIPYPKFYLMPSQKPNLSVAWAFGHLFEDRLQTSLAWMISGKPTLLLEIPDLMFSLLTVKKIALCRMIVTNHSAHTADLWEIMLVALSLHFQKNQNSARITWLTGNSYSLPFAFEYSI